MLAIAHAVPVLMMQLELGQNACGAKVASLTPCGIKSKAECVWQLGRFSGWGHRLASVIWKSVRLSLKLSPGSSTEPAIAPASTCGLGSGVFCSDARVASAGGLALLGSHAAY